MLEFFRRTQRYIFFVITVVIIISFSFFGTYSTLGSNQWREQIAFKAINGDEITRSDVDEMALFLATDNHDKIIYGGAWGPNFLNDGVIQKDFLETGLAEDLSFAYQEDLQEDIEKRRSKEKKYKLYAHPQAPFLGVASIWNTFSPEMNVSFNAVQNSGNGFDADAFHHRINLYLGEKKIPASTLRYILHYQEKQYADWLSADDQLNQKDLSLFGYHTFEDWFGPNFTRLISEFIINAAILAENQGYQVTKTEAQSDLIQNTQNSYQQNKNNPNLGVSSPEEYLTEQLRRMNMDPAKAIKIWQQILLFRRLFADVGSSSIIDALSTEKLKSFANENVSIDLYRLPPSLRLANYKDLQKFEAYLYAVTKQNKTDPLAVPQQFFSIEEINKKYPELIQKRYVLEVANVNAKSLQAKIGLRQLWDWEVEENHWTLLSKQFPILGSKKSETREERFETLENLDSKNRAAIDNYAKKQIIQENKEWIEQSLNQAKPEVMVIGLRTEGGKIPFAGMDDLKKREDFMRLLDDAMIGSNVPNDSPLYNFTADKQHFYRIAVLDRSENQEILTFAEAKEDGTLDIVLDRILEKYYQKNRSSEPTLYQNEKKEWKPFKEVREKVADQFLKKIIASLEPIYSEVWKDQSGTFSNKETLASLRLYPYMNQIKELKNQGSEFVVKKEEEKDNSLVLGSRSPLADQWKIEKTTIVVDRQNSEHGLNVSEGLALGENNWSAIKAPVNGDLGFYQVLSYGASDLKSDELIKQTETAQKQLGMEAKRNYMQEVLAKLKDKNAISLAYLKVAE